MGALIALWDDTTIARTPPPPATSPRIVSPVAPEMATPESEFSGKLNQLYQSYYETNAIIAAAIRKHAALELAILGSGNCRASVNQEVIDYAEEVVNFLFDQATRKYAVNNIPLKIDKQQELEELRLLDRKDKHRRMAEQRYRKKTPITVEEKYPIDFDLVNLHLEMKYGKGRGARIAHQQQAAIILKYFRLEENKFEECSYGVTISKSHYVSKEKWSGTTTYQIPCDSKQHWRELTQALIGFADYMQIPDLANELVALKDSYCEYGKLSMPTTWTQTRLKLKIYTSKMEFTMKREIAQKLQLYLGEFLA